jgi:hypothetical protein
MPSRLATTARSKVGSAELLSEAHSSRYVGNGQADTPRPPSSMFMSDRPTTPPQDAPVDGQASRPSRLLWWLQPKVALPLLLFGLLLLSPFFYRAHRIASVPDVGAPFDVAAFEAMELVPANNAADRYIAAVSLLQPGEDRDAMEKVNDNGWSAATPALIKWVDDNAAAAAEWRLATEMSEAMHVSPQDHVAGVIPNFVGLRSLYYIARMNAEHCLADGDVESAWGWLHGLLRASRHCAQHCTLAGRLIAASLFAAGTSAIERWAADPRVDARLLQQALQDVAALETMASPNSTRLKFEFLEKQAYYEDTPSVAETWIEMTHQSKSLGRVPMYFAGEPEYSRRLNQLLFRRWFHLIDQPLWARPKSTTGTPSFSDADLDDHLSNRVNVAQILVVIFEQTDHTLHREAVRQVALRQMLASKDCEGG